MAQQDQDILLGRLAIHYKFLTKDQAQQAIRLWKTTGQGTELGEFLVRESYLSAEVLPKLLRARTEYLRRKAQAAGEPAAGAEPAVESVGAATVRLTPEMLAQAGASPDGLPAPAPAGPATQVIYEPVATAPPAEAESPPELPGVGEPAAPSLPTPGELAEPPAFTEAATPSLEMAPPPETAPGEAAPAFAAPIDGAPVEPAPAESPGAGLLGYDPAHSLEDLLRRASELGASDLHIHSGAPIKVRLHGVLHDASPDIDRETARTLIYGVLADEQKEILEQRLQLDFSFQIDGVGRFRSNSYFQHRGLDGVFRIVPPEPPTLEQLGLPETLARFSDYHQGIVLFTGPAGCGKSSTMAALVRMINEKRPDHILTIEDPIEYVYTPQRCVVNQREVGPHTESFARALRAALREDPDVIVIGELRDLETIQLALTAAETGHVVLATLHTASTIPTINRLVGVFPPDQQAQIRTMVSESLRAIVSQRLVARADGQGRVPVLEILVNNKAIGNLIRDNRTFQIQSVLQTGGAVGMCELDASLAELVKNGVIHKEAARMEAIDPKRFA